MSEVKNPFVTEADAKRYNGYRPRYHHIPFEKLLDWYGQPFDNVLDVACGTGHSTTTLKSISKNLIGCDQSSAMLSEARNLLPEVSFYKCGAEFTPFESKSLDLINISMAYQWLDQKAFLFEVKRLLKPGGILAIDNFGFTGLMADDPDFKNYYKEFDKKNMTAVPRNPDYPDEMSLKNSELSFVHEISYQQMVNLNKDSFIEYLKTRSNFACLNEQQQSVVSQELPIYYGQKFKGLEKQLTFSGFTRVYRG